MGDDAKTIRLLTRQRDDAMWASDQLRDLCEKTASALKGADAEIARLRASVVLLQAQIAKHTAPRWWCICEHLNAGGSACEKCGSAKPAHHGRHA